LVEGKRRIFGWYAERLSHWNGGYLTPGVNGLHNSYWMTTFIMRSEPQLMKEKVIPRLKREGIDVRPFFYPLSAIPAYRNTEQAAVARELNHNAYAITPFGINLPSALSLTYDDISVVCDSLMRVQDELLNG
jgi:perosamine synthetase